MSNDTPCYMTNHKDTLINDLYYIEGESLQYPILHVDLDMLKNQKLHIYHVEIKLYDCYNHAKLKQVLEMKVLGDVEAGLVTNYNFLKMC